MINKFKKLKTYKKVSIILLLFFVLIIFETFLLMLRFNRINKLRPEIIGVSFSQVQAERYGSDWRQNYLGVLDDLGFKKLRIAAYWDRVEKDKGNFDFSEIDWMLSEAEKRNAKVTLVVGQKNIRYPECFYPQWVNTKDTNATSDQAVNYVQKVIERYKNNPTIKNWQLENEFILKAFGECPKNMLTGKQLKKELEALKSIDNSRPVLISQSDQYGFPVQGPFGDIFGFSMYKWSWKKEIGYYKYPQNGIYFWWKAGIISAFKNQDIKIHELQAEAWGPKGNEYLEYNEAMRSMNPKQFDENIAYARQTRIREFDLWGAEWWWHLKQQGNYEMWNKAKDLISTYGIANK